MANEGLKKMARDQKIPQWKIADALNISEFTYIRKLRHELSDEDRFLIECIIKELAKEVK